MRQNDPTFKSVLHNLREGTMDERSMDFLLNRCLYNLCPEEQEEFECTAIYLMPTWDQTRRITLKYLKTFQGPYAIIRPQYTVPTHKGKTIAFLRCLIHLFQHYVLVPLLCY